MTSALVIGSSSTALANLAYLIGAVVVAIIGGLIVWMRHRQPKSVDANMASFRRGLDALAPDARTSSPTHPRPEQFRIRPVSVGFPRTRVGSDHPASSSRPVEVDEDEAKPEGDGAPNEVGAETAAVEESTSDVTGGQGG